MPIRSPIMVFLGHVDHGKTSLADAIRGTHVAAREAGAITQMIGASYLPKETIDTLAQKLAQKMRVQLHIPGLLFIDTPGHEAFANLRERGGSIADMAILVVDIMQGFQPQTIESIKILKQYKTPFVVAANKIDALHGWKRQPTTSFTESHGHQAPHVQALLDEKIYALVGALGEHGFNSERFDRVGDFTQQVAILPVSAKTKEGLSELLMLIAGLGQKFLEARLQMDAHRPARGSILEVKEEKGLGTTLDVVIYDGVLRKNDEILFLTPRGVGNARVRGLLEPNPGGREKFRYVDEIVAAAGVKIFAPGLEDALPGSPLKAVENMEEDRANLESQFKELLVEKSEQGIVVGADSLGSLEALVHLLQQAGIPVKETKVGKITKKEVLTARAVAAEDRYLAAVLAFNVPILPEAREDAASGNVPVIWSNIIYDLLDRYQAWVKEEKERDRIRLLDTLPWPGKVRALPGCCFRASKPAIFGVEVLIGKIKTGELLLNAQGERLGEIKGIQHEKESLGEAEKGMQVAIACEGVVYHKDVKENDLLYVHLTPGQVEAWEKQKALLGGEEKQLLEELRSRFRLYF